MRRDSGGAAGAGEEGRAAAESTVGPREGAHAGPPEAPALGGGRVEALARGDPGERVVPRRDRGRDGRGQEGGGGEEEEGEAEVAGGWERAVVGLPGLRTAIRGFFHVRSLYSLSVPILGQLDSAKIFGAIRLYIRKLKVTKDGDWKVVFTFWLGGALWAIQKSFCADIPFVRFFCGYMVCSLV